MSNSIYCARSWGFMTALFVLCAYFLSQRLLWNGLFVDVIVEAAAHQGDAETSRTGTAAGVAVSSADDGSSCDVGQSSDCSDDDTGTCFKRRNECDSDLSYMLIHCQRTCHVCVDGSLRQNAGFGRIPDEISIHVLRVARRTNLYYQSLNIPGNPLVECRDKSDMCAFWNYEGQCTNPSFRGYMQDECPATCQLCTLVQASGFLQFVTRDLQGAYNDHRPNLFRSRKAALSLLMSKLGMDPSDIGKIFVYDAPINWSRSYIRAYMQSFRQRYCDCISHLKRL